MKWRVEVSRGWPQPEDHVLDGDGRVIVLRTMGQEERQRWSCRTTDCRCIKVRGGRASGATRRQAPEKPWPPRPRPGVPRPCWLSPGSSRVVGVQCTFLLRPGGTGLLLSPPRMLSAIGDGRNLGQERAPSGSLECPKGCPPTNTAYGAGPRLTLERLSAPPGTPAQRQRGRIAIVAPGGGAGEVEVARIHSSLRTMCRSPSRSGIVAQLSRRQGRRAGPRRRGPAGRGSRCGCSTSSCSGG